MTATQGREELTIKQRRFAEAIAAGATSATAAALAAGYPAASAHQRASENVRKRNVMAHVEAVRARRTDVVDVSRAAHLARLATIAKEARAVGQYSAAARCEELIGKVAGHYIERTESVNINMELTRMSPDTVQALIRQVSERLTLAIEHQQGTPMTLDHQASEDMPEISDT